MDNRRNKTLLRPGLKKNKSSGSSQDNYAGYYQGYIPSAAHAKGGVTKNRHPRGGVPAQQVHDAHAATAAATPATPAPPPPPLATTTAAAAQHTPFCGYCGHEWYGDNSYCVFVGNTPSCLVMVVIVSMVHTLVVHNSHMPLLWQIWLVAHA